MKNTFAALIIIITLALVVNMIASASAYAYSLQATTYNVNVRSLGAVPDGKTDSSEAFIRAWDQACASEGGAAIIVVPAGRYLIGRALTFDGCRKKNKAAAASSSVSVSIRLSGATLVAPADYRAFKNAGNWLMFRDVTGLSITGGTLDGQGQRLWDCRRAGSGECSSAFTALALMNGKNIVIRGLTSLNSPMFHVGIYGCQDVRVHGMRIVAPEDSPNTDGIHVQFSSYVTLRSSKIATGDDCVSVGPGTKSLWVEDIQCGPGHGISIGSLGGTPNEAEAGVEDVTVKSCTFRGTSNGVRIKTWGKPSTAFVTRVLFADLTMLDVENPIIIDQNYCPAKNCPLHASGVKISDVTYADIHGTSATQVAVKFDCSSSHPCTGIKLANLNLTYNTKKNAKPNNASFSYCSHAAGTADGLVHPKSCLL